MFYTLRMCIYILNNNGLSFFFWDAEVSFGFKLICSIFLLRLQAFGRNCKCLKPKHFNITVCCVSRGNFTPVDGSQGWAFFGEEPLSAPFTPDFR